MVEIKMNAKEYKKNMNEMKLMECISIREGIPNQIKVGEYYWMDVKSHLYYNDTSYATFYRDRNKNVEMGRFNVSHFQPVFRYLRHGASIEAFANENIGFLLEDILYYCKHNSQTSPDVRGIKQFITDNDINKIENLERRYMIRYDSKSNEFYGYSLVPYTYDSDK